MRFEDLGLAEPILRAVNAEGYTVPTPIQIKAIPHVLAGSDLLGCAQTGTGKTAAFALPILHNLSLKPVSAGRHDSGHDHPRGHHSRNHAASAPRALILAPTRELASQIADSFGAYGCNVRLKHTVLFGGVSQFHQVKALQRGVDILIATPGRLLDLMNQGHVDLRVIEILVLDEADRMLDMGFIHDIRTIIKRIPAKRQTLMFSATMPGDIRSLAATILNKPVSVQVNPPASTVESISQSVYFVAAKQKAALLAHLLKSDGMSRTLVFTRTKRGADKVVKHLTRAGVRAEAIHSNKSQNARTRALHSFKSHKPPVLVATDIASRGIDVDGISHVINFDVPHVPESYVHRIGRTARAGASGSAVSFCDPDERENLRAIERLTRTPITVVRSMPNLPMQDVLEASGGREPGGRESRGRQSQGGHSHRNSAGTRNSHSRETHSHSKPPRHHQATPAKAHVAHKSEGGSRDPSGSSNAAKNHPGKGFMQRGRGRARR